MTLARLQEAVADWHTSAYPTADVRDCALKLAEEAGEVARAVVERRQPSLWRNATSDLGDELGDVVIVCAALAARAQLDLDDVVARRLDTVRNR